MRQKETAEVRINRRLFTYFGAGWDDALDGRLLYVERTWEKAEVDAYRAGFKAGKSNKEN